MLNILVPLDGSALAERALPFAARIATAAGGRLTLVRASWVYPFAGMAPDEMLPPGAERVAAELADEAAGLRALGLPVETHVTYGDAPHAIREAARGRRADLIVMSTHGRGGLGRWVYGSVAEEVLRGTEAPVLLVPTACDHRWPTDRPLRVLVPLDGSDAAEEVLPAGGALARALQGEVVLLRAVPPVSPRPTGLEVVSFPPSYGIASQSDPAPALEDARRYLEDVAERLRGVAPVRAIRVEPAVPAAAIAEIARDERADLIAMATHGRTGLASLVMGSVAATTLQRATIPVLLTRPVALRRAAWTPPASAESVALAVPLTRQELGLVREALERLLAGDEPGEAPRELLARLARYQREQKAETDPLPLP